MFGPGTQNGVGQGVANIPALTALSYSRRLYMAVQQLFANGEPGFWLDPSDMSTMFTDAAGTTPVTAVEQPVGLILDKSKGLVLGAELVTNGNFSSGLTGWTNSSTSPATATINGSSQLELYSTATTNAVLVQSEATVAGKWYRVNISVAAQTAPFLRVLIGTGSQGSDLGGKDFTNTGANVKTIYFCATTTTSYITLLNGWAGIDTISNVSCKSLAGTHYYQSTAGVRPVLSARVNLLTETETIGASWTKSNGAVTANAGAAPNGTATASLFVPNTSNVSHSVLYAALTVGQSYKITMKLKAGGIRYAAISNAGASAYTTTFDLQAGTVGFTGGSCTPTISAVDAYGYYLCSVSFVAGYTTLSIYANNTSGDVNNFAGDGTSGFYIWGVDARPSDQATGLIPTYQRVNTSTDYDTAGFPLYLSGNGTQWMQCAAQDYTGVNKIMLCGGVRKKSDAALAVVFELSPTIASNNGAVLLSAPNSAAANLNFSSKGTTQVDNVVTTYTSPNTTVLTGLGDISAPSNIVRVNGAQVGSVSSTQGTGNYGNYAGFLFARNGASSMLTGNLYQLIARGSTVASNAAQISAAESWTDLKTKAY